MSPVKCHLIGELLELMMISSITLGTTSMSITRQITKWITTRSLTSSKKNICAEKCLLQPLILTPFQGLEILAITLPCRVNRATLRTHLTQTRTSPSFNVIGWPQERTPSTTTPQRGICNTLTCQKTRPATKAQQNKSYVAQGRGVRASRSRKKQRR